MTPQGGAEEETVPKSSKRRKAAKPPVTVATDITPAPVDAKEAHRQAMAMAKATHQQQDENTRRDNAHWVTVRLVWTGIGIVLVTSAGCIGLMFSPHASDSTKADALKGLLSVGLAAISFMAGKVKIESK